MHCMSVEAICKDVNSKRQERMIIKKNHKGYVVRVSENALISLVLSSLEAYAVKKKDITGKGRPQTRIETFGSVFGYELIMRDMRTLYQIEIAHVDTSAAQRRSSVDYSEEAILMKVDAITSFWPHLDYLGDFHSHPYKNKKEVTDIKGYFLSSDDRKSLNDDFWTKIKYRVGLVITIAAMEKAGTKACDWVASNCVEATLGNYRIWVASYCAYRDNNEYRYTKDNDSHVTLDCPALTGLQWEHTDFGRFKKGKHSSS